MQQHLKQLMMTLALLLTAATGAWATDTFGVKEITADMVPATWNEDYNTIVTPEDLADLGINFFGVTEAKAKEWADYPTEGRVRLLYAYSSGFSSVNWKNGTFDGSTGNYKRGQIYSLANTSGYSVFVTVIPSSASDVTVDWNETDKAWEFEMPEEGDVELEIAYKTVSQMTVTFDGEAIAAEGVTGYLRQESAFVSALAAAVTGVEDATFTVESSDATVIAFGESNAATGALADVKFLKEGQATLTVTFAGNDDYGRASQTIAVTVTEKTYDVALKEGAAHADQWQLKAGDGDFQVLQQPVTGVKATTKMKLKFTGDKSMLKGVRAKKKAAVKTITIAVDFHTSGQIATAPAMTIEFNTGETWADVAARYDWLDTYETYTVFYKDKDNILFGDVHTSAGGVKPSDPIDPNGSYYWGYE